MSVFKDLSIITDLMIETTNVKDYDKIDLEVVNKANKLYELDNMSLDELAAIWKFINNYYLELQKTEVGIDKNTKAVYNHIMYALNEAALYINNRL